MLCALNGQNAGQFQFIHLLGKERNGLKAGFRFGGAAHKSGIVAQTVIVHQIAERETVAEQNGLIGRSIHGSLIFAVQRRELFNIGSGVGSVGVLIVGVQLLQRLGNGIYKNLRVFQRKPNVLVLFFLMLVLFAPVLEELICRGLVLGTLRARYGVTLAWLVSALFFGVMHLQPVQVINAFVVGLILGYVYISTDSLWSVMILHAMNNAVAYLMMITGHANTLLIDLIHNRVVYVAVYVVAVALLIVSGRMMLLALRRIKEAEKNRTAA